MATMTEAIQAHEERMATCPPQERGHSRLVPAYGERFASRDPKHSAPYDVIDIDPTVDAWGDLDGGIVLTCAQQYGTTRTDLLLTNDEAKALIAAIEHAISPEKWEA